MNKQLALWQFIEQSLLQNFAVALLYVLESKGSSPGRQGFCMAVNTQHEMMGSIGGGIMEHKFVELAKDQFLSNTQKATIKQQVHDKAAPTNQSGMICSGEQTVLLYPLSVTDKHVIQQIIACLQANKQGQLQLSPKGISFSSTIPTNNFSFTMQFANNWLYQEKLGYKNHLHIIGGGHCSLALSELMSKMDFYIHVYEERVQVNTFLQNSFAHAKTTVADYSELNGLIPSGSNVYIVIMTVGYRTDSIALEALLEKDVKYLGVLGSKKKMEKLLADFKASGISPNKLDKIYTPIGLPIKSETPEEIAISIAAEIISVKNKSDIRS
jgi:xanthine dehydrogenase accessory factor